MPFDMSDSLNAVQREVSVVNSGIHDGLLERFDRRKLRENLHDTSTGATIGAITGAIATRSPVLACAALISMESLQTANWVFSDQNSEFRQRLSDFFHSTWNQKDNKSKEEDTLAARTALKDVCGNIAAHGAGLMAGLSLGYHVVRHKQIVDGIEKAFAGGMSPGEIQFANSRLHVDAQLAHLAASARRDSVHSVSFVFSDVSNAGLRHLRKFPNLGFVNLSSSARVTDKGLIHLQKVPNLKEVLANPDTLTDAGMKSLSGIAGLKYLGLAGARISDNGLSSFVGHPNLRAMNLWGAENITNGGMKFVGQIPGLRRLDLTKTNIGDEGIRALEQQTLVDVSLYGSRVTDCAMSSLRRMSSLERLDLGGTAITDGGVAQLSALPSLRRLNLTWARGLTDNVVPALSQMKNLEIVSLARTDLSPRAITDLRNALPKATILSGHSAVEKQIERSLVNGMYKFRA